MECVTPTASLGTGVGCDVFTTAGSRGCQFPWPQPTQDDHPGSWVDAYAALVLVAMVTVVLGPTSQQPCFGSHTVALLGPVYCCPLSLSFCQSFLFRTYRYPMLPTSCLPKGRAGSLSSVVLVRVQYKQQLIEQPLSRKHRDFRMQFPKLIFSPSESLNAWQVPHSSRGWAGWGVTRRDISK